MEALRRSDSQSLYTYRRGADGEIVAEEKDEVPGSKAEGERRWREVMEQRFLVGKDESFDYCTVDESEEYDDRGLEEREAEEGYFESQSPEFVGQDGRTVEGETGVQDF